MRFRYSKRKMDKLFANSEDPDQTPRSAASDLGLHCLSISFLGVSRLQWVNAIFCQTVQFKQFCSGSVDVSKIVYSWR